jgi:tetratricopeptide (TPR) repeat protein
MALGQTASALDAFKQAMTLAGSTGWLVAALAAAKARLGDTDDAERMLAELEQRATEEYVSPMALGVIYAALGQFDRAVDEVERSFAQRDCWVVSLGVEPAWAPLRGHPRFEAIVAKVGVMDGHDADHPQPRIAQPVSAA